jgi:hypothetical protein
MVGPPDIRANEPCRESPAKVKCSAATPADKSASQGRHALFTADDAL